MVEFTISEGRNESTNTSGSRKQMMRLQPGLNIVLNGSQRQISWCRAIASKVTRPRRCSWSVHTKRKYPISLGWRGKMRGTARKIEENRREWEKKVTPEERGRYVYEKFKKKKNLKEGRQGQLGIDGGDGGEGGGGLI